jgi:hypothetical protein
MPLICTASTEPGQVCRYFDNRGWADEPRSHAEVREIYVPSVGWRRTTTKKVSPEWLMNALAEGVTRVSLRVRYSDRRCVTADFSIVSLLESPDEPRGEA